MGTRYSNTCWLTNSSNNVWKVFLNLWKSNLNSESHKIVCGKFIIKMPSPVWSDLHWIVFSSVSYLQIKVIDSILTSINCKSSSVLHTVLAGQKAWKKDWEWVSTYRLWMRDHKSRSTTKTRNQDQIKISNQDQESRSNQDQQSRPGNQDQEWKPKIKIRMKIRNQIQESNDLLSVPSAKAGNLALAVTWAKVACGSSWKLSLSSASRWRSCLLLRVASSSTLLLRSDDRVRPGMGWFATETLLARLGIH